MPVPGLRDYPWDVTYSHEMGDLVELFYVPVLERADLYQRATGYFSANVLALAGRGLDGLIAGGGRMNLLVGCTLDEKEVDAIQAGYDVREAVSRSMVNKLAFELERPDARQCLGYVTWMIAHGFLDVKVAIPLDAQGNMRAGLGLYHSKMGLVTDGAGDRLVFRGSINETEAGWEYNCESFDVNCEWAAETDRKRVLDSEAEFAKLWADEAKSAKVMDVPEAVRQELMKFMPTDDRVVRPPLAPADETEQLEGVEPEGRTLDEQREELWKQIREAPLGPEGVGVAVATSVVEPWPHQLRAYKRMIDAWPFRLLIADEVGLGKTIEAGLIIRHAWISQTAKRILIMTPAGVMKQWQAELYEKFNLLVPIYDGQKLVWLEHHGRDFPLEQPVTREQWSKQPLVIVSSHLMRRKDRQLEMDEAEDWDLLVLDEAHHARRKAAGTKQEGGANRLLSLMQRVSEKAKSLLLMTATPMQVHPVEFWDLLNVLGLPQQWHEQAFIDYFDQLDKNPDATTLFGLAERFRAAEAAYGLTPDTVVEQLAEDLGITGSITRRRVLKALRDPETDIPLRRLDTPSRKLAIRVLKSASPVRALMSRHTRPLLRRYHQAGLLDAPIAERKPVDIAVKLTKKEREVYDRVEDYISDTYQKANRDNRGALGFIMTIYRRRLASSFYALRCTLNKRLEALAEARRTAQPLIDWLDEEDLPQDETASEDLSVDEAAELAAESLMAEEETEVIDLLGQIAQLNVDTKAIELKRHLDEAFADDYDSAIIFTQYTDTLDFLKEHLAERIDKVIGTYSGRGGEQRDRSGRWNKLTKEQVKRKLKTGDIQILICTDAAGEGLNMQTCGVLVNYDLPWNPMKVEQRIGRIDRIGQRYPEVRVINLAYADTVEADVYFALGDRIDLFQGLVGKLQPILSKLPKAFEAAALSRSSERVRERQGLLASVEQQVQAADENFDIDQVSEIDLQPPSLPASPLTLEGLDRVLLRPTMLPSGVECEPLDSRAYKVRLPGSPHWVRVTTSRQVFDEQFENHQLMIYGGPVFNAVLEHSN